MKRLVDDRVCASHVIPRNNVTRNLGDRDQRFLAALGMTDEEADG
jgi:hypothetical protein